MSTKKSNLVERMKQSAKKTPPITTTNDGEQHFGDGNRIGKKRIDCYVTMEEYRKLTIEGANQTPVQRPNRYAETIIRNSLK